MRLLREYQDQLESARASSSLPRLVEVRRLSKAVKQGPTTISPKPFDFSAKFCLPLRLARDAAGTDDPQVQALASAPAEPDNGDEEIVGPQPANAEGVQGDWPRGRNAGNSPDCRRRKRRQQGAGGQCDSLQF